MDNSRSHSSVYAFYWCKIFTLDCNIVKTHYGGPDQTTPKSYKKDKVIIG